MVCDYNPIILKIVLIIFLESIGLNIKKRNDSMDEVQHIRLIIEVLLLFICLFFLFYKYLLRSIKNNVSQFIEQQEFPNHRNFLKKYNEDIIMVYPENHHSAVDTTADTAKVNCPSLVNNEKQANPKTSYNQEESSDNNAAKSREDGKSNANSPEEPETTVMKDDSTTVPSASQGQVDTQDSNTADSREDGKSNTNSPEEPETTAMKDDSTTVPSASQGQADTQDSNTADSREDGEINANSQKEPKSTAMKNDSTTVPIISPSQENTQDSNNPDLKEDEYTKKDFKKESNPIAKHGVTSPNPIISKDQIRSGLIDNNLLDSLSESMLSDFNIEFEKKVDESYNEVFEVFMEKEEIKEIFQQHIKAIVQNDDFFSKRASDSLITEIKGKIKNQLITNKPLLFSNEKAKEVSDGDQNYHLVQVGKSKDQEKGRFGSLLKSIDIDIDVNIKNFFKSSIREVFDRLKEDLLKREEAGQKNQTENQPHFTFEDLKNQIEKVNIEINEDTDKILVLKEESQKWANHLIDIIDRKSNQEFESIIDDEVEMYRRKFNSIRSLIDQQKVITEIETKLSGLGLSLKRARILDKDHSSFIKIINKSINNQRNLNVSGILDKACSDNCSLEIIEKEIEQEKEKCVSNNFNVLKEIQKKTEKLRDSYFGFLKKRLFPILDGLFDGKNYLNEFIDENSETISVQEKKVLDELEEVYNNIIDSFHKKLGEMNVNLLDVKSDMPFDINQHDPVDEAEIDISLAKGEELISKVERFGYEYDADVLNQGTNFIIRHAGVRVKVGK